MSTRHARGLTAIALMLITTGCAVVNFITGAPSSKSTAQSHALLERRCTGCHVVPEPASMSAESWQAALKRMKRRMELPASEWDSLATMPTLEMRR